MKVQLFADPAYIGECIGEDREVFYVDIGGIDHGVPRMMMRTGGKESGIKVGFFRDDGLVEVPLYHVFASRRMAEIFMGVCEEKVRVGDSIAREFRRRNVWSMYMGEDGDLVGVEDLDETPRVRVDIEEIPDPILGTAYRRAEPVVAESDDSLHGVDYERTERTIEEMKQASMELGVPVVTAEQKIRGVMVDKSETTIEEPILNRLYTQEDWDRLARAAKREEEDE